MKPATVFLHGSVVAQLEAGALQCENRSIPLETVESVVAFPPARITSPLTLALADRGCPVTWLTSRGEVRARCLPVPDGSLARLIAQVDAHRDSVKRLELARSFVRGRVQGMRSSLLRARRDGRNPDLLSTALTCLSFSASDIRDAEDHGRLLAAEARAADAYWDGFGALVTNPEFNWNGRSRRPPGDELNALLSFLSVLWTVRCAGALTACGLDPRLGFGHVHRPGRDSLACDLVEEFRAFGPEREAVSLVNLGQLDPSHFSKNGEDGVWLNHNGRGIVLAAHHRRLGELVRAPGRAEPIPISSLPLIQAEKLARTLVGGGNYRPWRAR